MGAATAMTNEHFGAEGGHQGQEHEDQTSSPVRRSNFTSSFGFLERWVRERHQDEDKDCQALFFPLLQVQPVGIKLGGY